MPGVARSCMTFILKPLFVNGVSRRTSSVKRALFLIRPTMKTQPKKGVFRTLFKPTEKLGQI